MTARVIGELVDGQQLIEGQYVAECDGESLVVEAESKEEAAKVVAAHLDNTGLPAYRVVVRTDEGPAEFLVERTSKYAAIFLAYGRKLETAE